MKAFPWYILLAVGILSACSNSSQEAIPAGNTLYTSLPASYSGLEFENTLLYDRDFNVYTYRNFYNGGGVGLGDINGDGLSDIYFTSNMGSNKLFLNKGDMKFEDITEAAGVAGERAWSTGVSIADVNGDGLLDIYVCNSGDIAGDNKQNELFLNQGNDPQGVPTFTESAASFGLADRGFSTHAAFFDFDRDGDLDCYLLNNSYRAISSFNLMENERFTRDSVGGDKLFRNEGGTFVDISEEAGIYGSIIGFGLGVTVGDINQDNWPDIYVSNDFFERDYLYLNKQDGTFEEVLTEQMRAISAASMGADMADINNDGAPDIFVTDMLPEPDGRIKQVTTFEDWNKYQLNLRSDFYHQFTRNMLHVNNGDGTFSELSRLAGVEATDWSWGALIFDMDMDGLRDIFIANGIYQDLTDQDYLNFISDAETKRMIITRDGVDYKRLIDSIPVRPVQNYAFLNTGLEGSQGKFPRFQNMADDWGFTEKSFSNGSAYGDLDNDGDLDLVINNVNMPCMLYRSEVTTTYPDRNWLKLTFKGEKDNPFAVGTRIRVFQGDRVLYAEHMPMRGFQSTMDYALLIGLGENSTIDSLEAIWPNGLRSVTLNPQANTTLTLEQADATEPAKAATLQDTRESFALSEVSTKGIIDYSHKENEHSDFNRDPLLYHMRSSEGPQMAIGDVNGDGREDIYLCGAKDVAGQLFLQNAAGKFTPSQSTLFEEFAMAEEVDALFFDANGDNKLDLYVVCGSSELPAASTGLRDRLYLNNGRGSFTLTPQILPAGRLESTSCVAAQDFDGDGDQDLFVGTRLRPLLYGVPVNGYLLENDGQGNYKDVSPQRAPELKELGMITDVAWEDVDGDNDKDLVVVGEWMDIQLFLNEGGNFTHATATAGLENSAGWWTCIEAVDIDQDGDMDFVIGNHGLNSRFRAEDSLPISLFVNDWDRNGKADPIMARYEEGKLLPYVRKHDLTSQMPVLKRRYLRFSSYVGQEITDLFSEEQLNRAVKSEVYDLQSSVLINDGKGSFTRRALPLEAQVSPIYGILPQDLNGDGNVDLLLGGNLHRVKPEMGRYDANYGVVLLGDGTGQFEALTSASSGFRLEGEVRDIQRMIIGGKPAVVVARNNDPLQIFRTQ